MSIEISGTAPEEFPAAIGAATALALRALDYREPTP